MQLKKKKRKKKMELSKDHMEIGIKKRGTLCWNFELLSNLSASRDTSVLNCFATRFFRVCRIFRNPLMLSTEAPLYSQNSHTYGGWNVVECKENCSNSNT